MKLIQHLIELAADKAEPSPKIKCTFHANYNGWTIETKSNGIDSSRAEMLEAKFADITNTLVDENGYKGEKSNSLPTNTLAKLNLAAKKIVPNCHLIIKIDWHST